MSMTSKGMLIGGLVAAFLALPGHEARAQLSEVGRAKVRDHFATHIRRSKATITKAIRAAPPSFFGRTTVVWIWIKNNRIVDSRIEQSSGHAPLDEAALRIVRRASPLPQWSDVGRIENRTFLVPIHFTTSKEFSVSALHFEVRAPG